MAAARQFTLSEKQRQNLLQICSPIEGREDDFLESVELHIREYRHRLARDSFSTKAVKKILARLSAAAKRLQFVLTSINNRVSADENRALLVLIAASRKDPAPGQFTRKDIPNLLGQLGVLQDKAEIGLKGRSASRPPGRKQNQAAYACAARLAKEYLEATGKVPRVSRESAFYKLVLTAFDLSGDDAKTDPIDYVRYARKNLPGEKSGYK